MDHKSTDDYPIRREDIGRREETQRILCEDRGRDESNVYTNQETLRITNSHQRPEEKHESDFLSGLPEGANSTNTLISDF